MTRLASFSLAATILGTSALAALALGDDKSSRTLWVHLDPAAIAAKAPVGQNFASSTSFDAKTGTLRVVVKPGLSLDEVATKLSRDRNVLDVRSERGIHYTHETNLRSVHMLNEWIEKLGGGEEEEKERQREKQRERQNGKSKQFVPESEEEEAGTEYLRALREYIKVRAYPYDRIDSDAYDKAIAHAVKMKPAKIGPSAASSGQVSAMASGISGKWKFVGPNNLNTPYVTYYGVRPSSGRVNAIAYDPTNTKIIYVGAPQGGVMKSTDGGLTWSAIGDNWGYNTVSAIAVDPKNPTTIYAGTGDFQGMVGAYTMGVMKSTDGGVSWTNLGRASFGTTAVSGIVIDPANSANIVITTGRGPDGIGRVWRSTNAGQSWTAAINVQDSWSSLSFAAADSSGKRSLYAVGGSNLYRSDDSGATWTKLTSPAAASTFNLPYIAGSAVDSKTAYILSTSDQKIFKTKDSGATWSDITGSFPGDYNWSQGFYDWYIACFKDGSADHIFTGLIDVVESPDGGTTWKSVGLTYTGSAKTHNDQHSFAVNPTNPKEVMMGNDGGLYKGVNNGGTWAITGLSDKLGITQFYNVVWHPTDKTRILGGTQDNASPVAIGDLSKWENVGGGDGGFCAINPVNPSIQFVTIYGFTVIMTTDSWKTAKDISPNIGTDASPFVTPIFQDPVRTRYLYGCTNYLWRYDTSTSTWSPRLGGKQLSNGNLIHTVAVAPSNGDVIYTGSDDGRVFVSTNAGGSFRNINTSSLPNRAITSISVNPTNPNDILVTLSGTGTKHVFQCANTSAAAPSYTSIDGTVTAGLPDVPANIIERDPFKPTQTLYVGTDIGVFSSGDGGKTWGNATVPLGLPNVQVNSLSANAKTGQLSAGTYGRGIWSINLGTASNLGPNAFAVTNGTKTSGTLASLTTDDDNRIGITSTMLSGIGQTAGISASFTAPGTGKLLALSFEVSALANTTQATWQFYVKNQRTGLYEILKAQPTTTTRTTMTVQVPGTIADYMTSARKIEIITRALVPSRLNSPSFQFQIDRTTALPSTDD